MSKRYEKLTQFCFDVDHIFKQLFDTYQTSLKLQEPKYGFLIDDCYSPYTEDECYPCIDYQLTEILKLYNEIQTYFPSHIHSYLGQLSFILEEAEEYCLSVEEKNNAYDAYQNILKLIKEGYSFLKSYNYKETTEYKANSAILFLSKLLNFSQPYYTDNPVSDKILFKTEDSKKELTLEDIAQLVCKNTEKPLRNIQFIAIGIQEKGHHIITTNYHAPAVFRLDDVLDTRVRFQEIESLFRQYKQKNDLKTLNYNSNIHAETLLAALAKALNLQDIIIIDGQGKKNQNCVFCSQFLGEHGFSSEPHVEKIQNYETPSKLQIEELTKWINYLISSERELIDSEKESKIHYIYTAKSSKEKNFSEETVNKKRDIFYKGMHRILDMTSQRDFMLNTGHPLSFFFSHIKKNYSEDLFPIEGLKKTYHESNRLSHPTKTTLKRTLINNKSEIVISEHRNDKFKLFSDSRLRISKKNPKRLSAVDIHSPRSDELVKFSNEWLEAGGESSKVNMNLVEGKIELSRNVKTMKKN